MNLRRALTTAVIAVLCLLATQSISQAACWYPWSHTTHYWYPNSCGPNPKPWEQCVDVLILAGESGIDCDGSTWSWGDTNPALYQTHDFEGCDPICE